METLKKIAEIIGFGSILSAAIIAALTYYFTTTQQLETKIFTEKMSRYEKIISYLYDGFINKSIIAPEQARYKAAYLKESYSLWLYAPKSVIIALQKFEKSFASYNQALNEQNKNPEQIEALNHQVNIDAGTFIKEMRKDTMNEDNLLDVDFMFTTVIP